MTSDRYSYIVESFFNGNYSWTIETVKTEGIEEFINFIQTDTMLDCKEKYQIIIVLLRSFL